MRLIKKELLAADAMDFDDMICKAVELLRAVRRRAGAATRTSWRYVLVDEYQDTNHAQYPPGEPRWPADKLKEPLRGGR